MIVNDDDLYSMAESVWQSMLGLDIERSDGATAKIGDRAVTACVQITGDWEGAVTVQCDMSLAQQIAAAMFAMEIDELSDDEIRDALGEVANMTGGNVKGLAPGENQLAIPSVVVGDEDALRIPNTTVQNRVGATSGALPVIFTVLAKTN